MRYKNNLICERFLMNLPDRDVIRVQKQAAKYGITMSWFYRAVLFALEKRFKNSFPETMRIKRPGKFSLPFRQVVVCMYGDKKKWMMLSRLWQVELGPLLRFGLELYFTGELELDLESVETVKEAKSFYMGKLKIRKCFKNRKRCLYQYQNEADLYCESNFHPKNSKNNIILMKRGIANRKYPLIPF